MTSSDKKRDDKGRVIKKRSPCEGTVDFKTCSELEMKGGMNEASNLSE